jgi:TatA/E family protein of Tat protein translocase
VLPNIGLGELAVIVLIALMVFGPNKLPEMMRSAGKMVGKFQRDSAAAMQELKSATREFKDVTSLKDLGAMPKLGTFDAPDPVPASAGTKPARAKAQAKAPKPPAARPKPPAARPKPPAARPKPATKSPAGSRKAATKRPAAKRSAPRPPAVAPPFEDT